MYNFNQVNIIQVLPSLKKKGALKTDTFIMKMKEEFLFQ